MISLHALFPKQLMGRSWNPWNQWTCNSTNLPLNDAPPKLYSLLTIPLQPAQTYILVGHYPHNFLQNLFPLPSTDQLHLYKLPSTGALLGGGEKGVGSVTGRGELARGLVVCVALVSAARCPSRGRCCYCARLSCWLIWRERPLSRPGLQCQQTTNVTTDTACLSVSVSVSFFVSVSVCL